MKSSVYKIEVDTKKITVIDTTNSNPKDIAKEFVDRFGRERIKSIKQVKQVKRIER